MREYYFEGQLRLDWGFGNPNVTGALIAMLMVGAWLFAYCGRWGFWVALALNAGLGICLIETFSRGSMVALVAGLAPVVLMMRRPWPKWRLIAAAVVLIGLGAYAWNLRAAHRYGQGILSEDGSVSNRWLIYRVVPRMMWDAPQGWGWNRSAEAFRQWYQPVGRKESYVHLVSSHATWLVEAGWPLRAGYLLGWAAVLGVCAPSRRKGRWRSATLGIWISFGVASVFTHVAAEKWLWGLPAAALLLAVGGRLVARDGLTRGQWLAIPAGAVAAMGGLMIVGLISAGDAKISLRDGTVTARLDGSENVQTIGLLLPDRRVTGELYGQQIRRALQEPQARALRFQVQWVAQSPMDSGLDILIVPGEAAKTVSVEDKGVLVAARSVLFLNPSTPSQVLVEELPNLPRLHYVTGEMWGGSAKYVWQSLLRTHTGATTVKLPMAGMFIPRWTSILSSPETLSP